MEAANTLPPALFVARQTGRFARSQLLGCRRPSAFAEDHRRDELPLRRSVPDLVTYRRTIGPKCAT